MIVLSQIMTAEKGISQIQTQEHLEELTEIMWADAHYTCDSFNRDQSSKLAAHAVVEPL